MEIRSVRGFCDILPHEAGKWRLVEEKSRKVLEDFGFSEIILPIVERTELFIRGIGESTEIVEKEMYTFLDKKGESLTLRPEGTAPLVRAYIENKLYTHDIVSRLYYIGPMFRYERPQKGRLRQFYQIGAEVLGIDSPMIDAEVIYMIKLIIDQLNINNVTFEINTIGCRKCRDTYRKQLSEYLSTRIEHLCEDCRRRLSINPLRILDCKNATCISTSSDAPNITDYVCKECGEHFKDVKYFLKKSGVDFIINPRIVRGLDYYTRTTFEVRSSLLGAQNAIAAGGRYDGLVEELGGKSTPGFGFAMGMERVVMLLPSREEARGVEIFIAALGRNAQEFSFQLKLDLERRGVKTEMEYSSEKSLKSQMRRADRIRASYVLIVGERELESGRVILRDMKGKEQEEIPIEGISESIISKIRNRRGKP